MQGEVNYSELLAESLDIVISQIKIVDTIGILLMLLGKVLVGRCVFNVYRSSAHTGNWIISLWLSAVPIYMGAIILGLKYGFN